MEIGSQWINAPSTIPRRAAEMSQDRVDAGTDMSAIFVLRHVVDVFEARLRERASQRRIIPCCSATSDVKRQFPFGSSIGALRLSIRAGRNVNGGDFRLWRVGVRSRDLLSLGA